MIEVGFAHILSVMLCYLHTYIVCESWYSCANVHIGQVILVNVCCLLLLSFTVIKHCIADFFQFIVCTSSTVYANTCYGGCFAITLLLVVISSSEHRLWF